MSSFVIFNFDLFSLFFSTKNRGLKTLPESEFIFISLSIWSYTIETSWQISPVLLNFLKFSVNSLGLFVTPNQFPLMNILALFSFILILFSSLNSDEKFFSKISFIISQSVPTETEVIKDKFFTSPHPFPSGVSQGHSIPQWVLCSCLGFAILVDLSRGVFTVLKWDKVAKNVSLFKDCVTPELKNSPPFPFNQFPVDKE